MCMKLVPVILSVLLTIPVTTSKVSVHVKASFKKSVTSLNGPVRCALDTANKTSSSSSLEDCSLDCTRDNTCIGFNIKN